MIPKKDYLYITLDKNSDDAINTELYSKDIKKIPKILFLVDGNDIIKDDAKRDYDKHYRLKLFLSLNGIYDLFK